MRKIIYMRKVEKRKKEMDREGKGGSILLTLQLY